MGRWSLPSPPLAPSRPLTPTPTPTQPYPLTAPLHSTHPPARPIIIDTDSSQITNDNGLFQHVCVATNLGELTIIESALMFCCETRLLRTHNAYTMLPPLHRHVEPDGVQQPTPPHHTNTATTTTHRPPSSPPSPEQPQLTNRR